MSFLCEVINIAEKAGARRFRFADTVGILEPFTVLQKIRKLRRNTSLEIEMHAHDDFGLATANTLAAVRGGATHINTTVHGLGERAGNAALEEVVVGLAHLYKKEVGISLDNYDYVSKLVEQASGHQVPWHKSVVGRGAFSHEAGIHVDGLIKDPANYQSLSPAEVGRSHQFILGKHSGTRGVMFAYEQLGVTLTRDEAECLLSLVRQHVNYQKSSPTKQDLERFYLMLRHETSNMSYCEAM
jgi:homocitrate synthase NifV